MKKYYRRLKCIENNTVYYLLQERTGVSENVEKAGFWPKEEAERLIESFDQNTPFDYSTEFAGPWEMGEGDGIVMYGNLPDNAMRQIIAEVQAQLEDKEEGGFEGPVLHGFIWRNAPENGDIGGIYPTLPEFEPVTYVLR